MKKLPKTLFPHVVQTCNLRRVMKLKVKLSNENSIVNNVIAVYGHS